MITNKFQRLLPFLMVASVGGSVHRAEAARLSLGADYFLRGVSITERDNTIDKNAYYDQRLIAYMTADLSKDVEAAIKIQSITPWGLETSSETLHTRYPHADGTPWVQNAYARLPHIWNDRVIVTIGRQPLIWGDGEILSDDDLGFNALRAQVKSPFRWLPIDLDGFTAKISETLRSNKDTDLYGANIGLNIRRTRWEVFGLMETNDADQTYRLGSSTASMTAAGIDRNIFGVRAKATLKDAYLKAAYYIQQGTIKQSIEDSPEIKLGGTAYSFGLGGKSNSRKWGRFGAALDYSIADGDKSDTPEKDEAFRPTYASRWSGLERRGYGRYFAATFSDAYSPTDPFGIASSTNTGLPSGGSGIETIHFGVESTPWAQWTFSFDYFLYKLSRNPEGKKDLGSELDYGIEYRYSGLISFRAGLNQFNTGEAFSSSENVEDTKRKATSATIEALLKF